MAFQVYKKGQGSAVRAFAFVTGAGLWAYGCRWIYYLPGIDSLWFKGGVPLPFRLTGSVLLAMAGVAGVGVWIHRSFVRGREDHAWVRWGGLTGALILAAVVTRMIVGSGALQQIGALSSAWAELPFSWGAAVATALFAYGVWILFDRVVNLPRSADFLIETEIELRKVAWPARREYLGAAVVVIVCALIVSLYLLGVDWLLSILLSNVGLGF